MSSMLKAKVICALDVKCQLGSISACFVTLLDLQGVVMAACWCVGRRGRAVAAAASAAQETHLKPVPMSCVSA